VSLDALEVIRVDLPSKQVAHTSAWVWPIFDNSAAAPIRTEAHRSVAVVITVTYETSSDEMNQLQSRLSKIGSLSAGWDGYSAPAPSSSALRIAKDLLKTFCREDFAPKRVSPSAVGGVGITHKRKTRKIYIEIYNNGEVYALFSDGISEPDVKQVELDEQSLLRLVRAMRVYLDA
jgi:hypothetical protein